MYVLTLLTTNHPEPLSNLYIWPSSTPRFKTLSSHRAADVVVRQRKEHKAFQPDIPKNPDEAFNVLEIYFSQIFSQRCGVFFCIWYGVPGVVVGCTILNPLNFLNQSAFFVSQFFDEFIGICVFSPRRDIVGNCSVLGAPKRKFCFWFFWGQYCAVITTLSGVSDVRTLFLKKLLIVGRKRNIQTWVPRLFQGGWDLFQIAFGNLQDLNLLKLVHTWRLLPAQGPPSKQI